MIFCTMIITTYILIIIFHIYLSKLNYVNYIVDNYLIFIKIIFTKIKYIQFYETISV